MLATQANHLVASKELEKGCFVRLAAYQANQVKDKKYDEFPQLKERTKFVDNYISGS